MLEIFERSMLFLEGYIGERATVYPTYGQHPCYEPPAQWGIEQFPFERYSFLDIKMMVSASMLFRITHLYLVLEIYLIEIDHSIFNG